MQLEKKMMTEGQKDNKNNMKGRREKREEGRKEKEKR
jgi:hypothetical protein